MTLEHFDKLVTALEQAGCKITNRSANRARSQCPAHGGDGQNLSIFADTDRVNGVCHSHDCDFREVLEAVGLTVADRYANPRGSAYEYRDLAGQLLRTVRRTPDKRFHQEINEPRVTLFRLERIPAAIEAGGPLYLVEGEADVLAAESAGVVATTAPQGAGNFAKADLSPLAGAHVIAVVDRDDQGAKWAETVRSCLSGVADVRFMESAHGKDLSDHLAAGHALEELLPYTFPTPDEPTPELLLIGAALRDLNVARGCGIHGGMFLDAVLGEAFDQLRDAKHAPTIPQLVTKIGRASSAALTAALDDARVRAMVSDHERYAAEVASAWERRAARGHIEVAANLLHVGASLEDVQAELMRVGRASGDDDKLADRIQTLGEYVDQDTPPENWVIPDMLAVRDRFILTGFEGGGKALAVDTPIPTPTGWTTMGEIRAGESVLGMDGKPVEVVAATDVMHDRPCYRVTFSDGSEIVADAEHQWLTETLAAREAASRTNQRHKRAHFPAVVTTREIAATLKARGGHCLNHGIRTAEPLDLPEADLPIDPYVLGAWLGDGHSDSAAITCHPDDAEIIDRIAQSEPVKRRGEMLWGITDGVRRGMGDRGTSLQSRLRAAGLLGNKHVPDAYLRSSKGQRLALLRGLMDTDGSIARNGLCEFSVCSKRITSGVLELLHTLGVKATVRESPALLNGREVGTRYRIKFVPLDCPFHLNRKAERFRPTRTDRGRTRYVTTVERIESVPVRCIQVANSDRMYLAGREMIPTHNSTLLRQIAACVAVGCHPFTRGRIEPAQVLFVDCENPSYILQRKFRGITDVLRMGGYDVGAARMMIYESPAGLDLTSPKGRAELRALCSLTSPDLLVIGPIYKMYVPSDARDEVHARQVAAVIDEIRADHGCAVMTEHHTPMDQGGKRPIRPVGTGLWMRWPEFGFGLQPEGDAGRVALMPWRGSRDERDWPRHLQMSGTAPGRLPWSDADNLGSPWNHRAITA